MLFEYKQLFISCTEAKAAIISGPIAKKTVMMFDTLNRAKFCKLAKSKAK